MWRSTVYLGVSEIEDAGNRDLWRLFDWTLASALERPRVADGRSDQKRNSTKPIKHEQRALDPPQFLKR
jgi:hypothetical protein